MNYSIMSSIVKYPKSANLISANEVKPHLILHTFSDRKIQFLGTPKINSIKCVTNILFVI